MNGNSILCSRLLLLYKPNVNSESRLSYIFTDCKLAIIYTFNLNFLTTGSNWKNIIELSFISIFRCKNYIVFMDLKISFWLLEFIITILF